MLRYTHFDLQRTDIGKQTITTGQLQLLAILLMCTFHFIEARVMNCEKIETSYLLIILIILLPEECSSQESRLIFIFK